jgi:hypothetical protein
MNLSKLGRWRSALRHRRRRITDLWYECGAWAIVGSRGTIHTWGDGRTCMLFVACRSALHWTATWRVQKASGSASMSLPFPLYTDQVRPPAMAHMSEVPSSLPSAIWWPSLSMPAMPWADA